MAKGSNEKRDGFSGKQGGDLKLAAWAQSYREKCKSQQYEVRWREALLQRYLESRRWLCPPTLSSDISASGVGAASLLECMGQAHSLLVLRRTSLCWVTSWLLLAQPATPTPHRETSCLLPSASPGVSVPQRWLRSEWEARRKGQRYPRSRNVSGPFNRLLRCPEMWWIPHPWRHIRRSWTRVWEPGWSCRFHRFPCSLLGVGSDGL